MTDTEFPDGGTKTSDADAAAEAPAAPVSSAASDADDKPDLNLTDLSPEKAAADRKDPATDDDLLPRPRTAADLEAVFDVPVKVSAVLGRSRMEVADLLKLGTGSIVELDRKIGEPIDIYVNNRLVARGEVVLVEDRLGVTMTEIIKS